MGRTWITGASLAALGIALFTQVLARLYGFSQSEGSRHYSHFVLIPVIAGYFAFVERRGICQAAGGQPNGLSNTCSPRLLGPGLVAFSLLIYLLGTWRIFLLSPNDHLALMSSSLVLYLIGSFISVFGLRAFYAVRFPFSFLVFMVPIPEFVLHAVVVALQTVSASVVDLLFTVTQTVYHRDGFLFSLPGLTIEIAEQCSGIRSSLSLVILSILAGHISLRTTWGKVLLALAVFPITVFKNGVRIVLLSLLAVHWDPAILHGGLHTAGGIPFFVVAMALLGLVLVAIRKLERRAESSARGGAAAVFH